MHQGRMVIVLYQRRSLLKLSGCIHAHIHQGGDGSTLSSLRAYNQNQNDCTHLLLRHPLLHLNIPGMNTSTFLRAQLVGFEHIFTCTRDESLFS